MAVILKWGIVNQGFDAEQVLAVSLMVMKFF